MAHSHSHGGHSNKNTHKCSILKRIEAPTVASFEDLPMKADSAYILVTGETTLNQLYYVNKKDSTCIRLPLNAKQIADLNRHFSLSDTAHDKAKSLSKDEQKRITSITGHTHHKDGDFWTNFAAFTEVFCDFAGNASFWGSIIAIMTEGDEEGSFTPPEIAIGVIFGLLCSLGSTYCHRILNTQNEDDYSSNEEGDSTTTDIKKSSIIEIKRALSPLQKLAVLGDFTSHLGDTSSIMNLVLLSFLKNIDRPPSTPFLIASTSILLLWGGFSAYANTRTCAYAVCKSNKKDSSPDEPDEEAALVFRLTPVTSDRWIKFTAGTELFINFFNNATLYAGLYDLFAENGKEQSGFTTGAVALGVIMGAFISPGFTYANYLLNLQNQPKTPKVLIDFEGHKTHHLSELPKWKNTLLAGAALGCVGDNLGMMNLILLFVAERIKWAPSMLTLGLATGGMVLWDLAAARANIRPYKQALLKDHFYKIALAVGDDRLRAADGTGGSAVSDSANSMIGSVGFGITAEQRYDRL